jgi:sphingomyelin phosphodiesterase acid-like 3
MMTENGEPFSFGMILPAVSPVFGTNPGFRIFNVDKSNYSLQSYKNYYMDLYESNNKGRAIWKTLYNSPDLWALNSVNTKTMQNRLSQVRYSNSLLFISIYIKKKRE